MQIGTKAVVLSARNMEEHDRLVTLLTQDHGLVTAYAKGARRQKGTMASATEQLSYSAFQLFRSREKTYVDKAEAETIFFAIRQEMDRLSLASYFCQLCRELIPEGDTQPGYLHLMMNTLTLLDRGKLPLGQLKAVFELRLLTMSGYMPDLVACAACGSPPEGEVHFSPAAGGCTAGDAPPGQGQSPFPPGCSPPCGTSSTASSGGSFPSGCRRKGWPGWNGSARITCWPRWSGCCRPSASIAAWDTPLPRRHDDTSTINRG